MEDKTKFHLNKNSTYNLLKDYCTRVYFFGIGDFWFETLPRNKYDQFYKYFSCFALTMFGIFTILETLEAVLFTFPSEQHQDAVSYAISHNIIVVKFYLFRRAKQNVKNLLQRIIRVCEKYEEPSALRRQSKRTYYYFWAQIIVIYFALFNYVLDGARRAYYQGEPFTTVITYWPLYEDRSIMATAFRVFYIPVLWSMMAAMILTDSFVMVHLVIISFKFMTLRRYYENIREELNKICERNDIGRGEKLKQACLEGILMHRELISVTREVDKVYGAMMSLQVSLTSAVTVLLFLRLALLEHPNFANILMTIGFIMGLFVQLALYLWNAGEITYQASLLSTAIFHCGWQYCSAKTAAGKDARRLVLLSCAQAQQPLIMKAFGIQNLSYDTFVGVARTTYSVFAVFN